MKQTLLADHPERQYRCRVSFEIFEEGDATVVAQSLEIAAPRRAPKVPDEPKVFVKKCLRFVVGRSDGLRSAVATSAARAPDQERAGRFDFVRADGATFALTVHPDGKRAFPVRDVDPRAIPMVPLMLGSFAYLATRLDLSSSELQLFPAFFMDDLADGGAGEYRFAGKVHGTVDGIADIEFRIFHKDLARLSQETVLARFDPRARRFLSFELPQRGFPMRFVPDTDAAVEVPAPAAARPLAATALTAFAHEGAEKTLRFLDNAGAFPHARVLFFDPIRIAPSAVPALAAREVVQSTATAMGLCCTTLTQRVAQPTALRPILDAFRDAWNELFTPVTETYVLVDAQSAVVALDFFATLHAPPILIFHNPPWKDAAVSLDEHLAFLAKNFPDFHPAPVKAMLKKYPRAVYTAGSALVPANLKRLLQKAAASSLLAA